MIMQPLDLHRDTGKHIVLHLVNDTHTNLIHRCMNDTRLTDTYPVSSLYTLEDAKNYVMEENVAGQRGERFSFAILHTNQFAGICTLCNVQGETAKVDYWIVPEFWNQGIASLVLSKLIDYAKIELNLKLLKTGVLARNLASRRVLEKNGFSVECTLINEDKYHKKFKGETIIEMKLNL